MNCNICFEKYNKSETVPTTCIPCGHTFCKKCIDELKKQEIYLNCPSCRQRVTAEKPCFAIIGNKLKYIANICIDLHFCLTIRLDRFESNT